MKCDFDLLRKILLGVYNSEDIVDHADSKIRDKHYALCIEAGFLHQHPDHSPDASHYFLRELTWQGQKVVATIADDDLWEEARGIIASDGITALPFYILLALLGKLADLRLEARIKNEPQS